MDANPRYRHGTHDGQEVTFMLRPRLDGREAFRVEPGLRGVPETVIEKVRRLFIANPEKITKDEMAPLLEDAPLGKSLRNRIAHWMEVRRAPQSVQSKLEQLGFIERQGPTPGFRHGTRTWSRTTIMLMDGRTAFWISPNLRGVDDSLIFLIHRLFSDPAGLTKKDVAPLLEDTALAKALRNRMANWGGSRPGQSVSGKLEQLGFMTLHQHWDDRDAGWRERWIRMLRRIGSKHVPSWARPGTEWHWLIQKIDGPQ